MNRKLVIFWVRDLVDRRNPNLISSAARSSFDYMRDLNDDGFLIPNFALAHSERLVGYGAYQNEMQLGSIPTVKSVSRMLSLLSSQIPVPISKFVSYAYRSRHGEWFPTPIQYAGSKEWSRNRVPPNSGLLLDAMQQYGCKSSETLFVANGDVCVTMAESLNVTIKPPAEYHSEILKKLLYPVQ